MRTGYTAILDEKPNCTFPEFLWRCARAFSPILNVEQRDSWRIERLKALRKDLDKALKRTPLLWAHQAEADYKAEQGRYVKDLASYERTLRTFTQMRDQVIAWTPPTQDHNGLKVFMLEQLDITLNFLEPPEPPKLQNWETLRDVDVKFLAEQIEYYEGKERDSTVSRQKCMKWIDDLKGSVPCHDPRGN